GRSEPRRSECHGQLHPALLGDLIAPGCPAGPLLAGEQLKPADVAIEPLQALVHLLRLLAVALDRRKDHLAHGMVDDLEPVAPGRQQDGLLAFARGETIHHPWPAVLAHLDPVERVEALTAVTEPKGFEDGRQLELPRAIDPEGADGILPH